MQLTLYEQTCIFLWSFLIGVVLSVIYTLLSLWRIISPHGKLLMFITDFLMVVMAAILNFLFALTQTNGHIRGYVLLAEIVSFLVLYLTLGKLICKSAFVIQNAVKTTVSRVTSPIRRFAADKKEKIRKKYQKMHKKGKKP